MKLSVQYIRKSIQDNQLDYITLKSIDNHDYNKLNMIITLSTGFIPSIEDIRNLIESFDN